MADKFITYELLHKAGTVLIDDTAQYTGPFKAFTAVSGTVAVDVSDCVFGATMTNFDADFDVANGVTIYGDIDVLSLNSGKVVAYKA